MITYKQLTLAEIFEDFQNKFDNDKYQFLSLLGEAIDLDEIVPSSFVSNFYASTGRPRKYQLYPMLKALLIQRIFSIPTDTLLIVFLKSCQFHFWCKSCRKCCRYFPDPVYQLYQSRGTCIYLRHQF